MYLFTVNSSNRKTNPMKNSILLVLCCLSFGLTAQLTTEEYKSMINGSQLATILIIADEEQNFVEKEWKAYLKTYGKLKAVRKSDEKMIESVRIMPVLGTEAFNLYSKLTSKGNTTDLVVWIQTDEEEYLSSKSNPEGYEGLIEFLLDFEFSVRKNRISLEVEEHEKVLVLHEKDLEKLADQNEKLHEVIVRAKETIAKAEKDIELNLTDQESSRDKIENQKKTVSTVKEKHKKMKRSPKK